METKKAILKIESYGTDGVFLSLPDEWIKDFLAPLFEYCNEKKSGYVQVEFSAPGKKRTIAQNSKWWALCTEYAKYIGSTREEVALGVKYRAMEEGLWKGKPIPFTNGMREPMSTTKASTEQMSILIEVLYRIAAEDGYVFSE